MTEDLMGEGPRCASGPLFEDSIYTYYGGRVARSGPSVRRASSSAAKQKPSVWYDPRSGGRVRFVEFKKDGFYRKYILEEREGAMEWIRWKDPPRTPNERKLVFEKQGEGCFVERLIEHEDVEDIIWDETDDSEDERRRMQQYHPFFMRRARKRSSWQSGDTDIHYDPRSNGCIRYERGDDGHYRKFRLQQREGAHEWVPIIEQRNLSQVVYQRSPEGFYLEVLLPLPITACLPKSFEDRLLREWTEETGSGGALLSQNNNHSTTPAMENEKEQEISPVTVFVHGPCDKESTHLTELIERTSVFSEAERLLVNQHHLSPRHSPSLKSRGQPGDSSADRRMRQSHDYGIPPQRKLTDLTEPSPPPHHSREEN